MTTVSIVELPVELNITVLAGNHFERTFFWFEQGTDPRVPIDMRGEHTAQIRQVAVSEEVIAEFELDDSDAANGNVKLILHSDVSAGLGVVNGKRAPEIKYDFDWQFTRGSGRITTPFKGKLTVRSDVTRPVVP